MNTDTFMIVLLVWAVVGFLAAIAFGRAIQGSDDSPDDEVLASSTGSIKYLRRDKHKRQTERSASVRQRDGAKLRATG
jgi:hypothetical protein